MNKKLENKWKEAEKTGEPISIGNTVICDICDKDYTDLPDSGGFIFTSKGYCPECADDGLINIKKYNEEQFIKAFCPKNISFADFIIQYRGNNNFIHIQELKTR